MGSDCLILDERERATVCDHAFDRVAYEVEADSRVQYESPLLPVQPHRHRHQVLEVVERRVAHPGRGHA
jgi:hypothetical protein